MEDDSRIRGILKWFFGVLGFGAVAAAVLTPDRKVGLWTAFGILVIGLLLFGAYLLFLRLSARRQRERFSSAVESQMAAVPKSISDPNKRADLDRLRQKFQRGLQEFKTRKRDIYRLPWYVIIGEPGSGKTEAIRHSGIEFPPGFQDELQGSGGTMNMDWWFTNHGIILDTAGKMIFNEAGAGDSPEWPEFLRLLRKARPREPINGLFLVLSVESLIKDSAETIKQKATKLARQLDLLQRTLEVRFPVYLLVTKGDLLAGFREFFDSVDDPSLQHQMFGWSNPDPLDAAFRADLVEDYLKSISERLRRRRLALLREPNSGGWGSDGLRSGSTSLTAPKRRLDDLDALFALPESILRLAPRLRNYLQFIFVAGEWSEKPVFFRGLYFTSSMREGRALDEAIAFATGLSLDQLPEDRAWERNRAFFLRDMFVEKAFPERGLVTRASNTLRLLQQRRWTIYGTASMAMLLVLIFGWFGFRDLKANALKEARFWEAATNAASWARGEWSPSIVRSDNAGFSYSGTNLVEVAKQDPPPTVVEYQRHLKDLAQKGFSVAWIFKPIEWVQSAFNKDLPQKRRTAQKRLFEGGVLMPLVARTRTQMMQPETPPAGDAVTRHREALLSLMRLEADGLAAGSSGGLIGSTNAPQKAERYLRTFLSYLTKTNQAPDTNLVDVFAWTYSKNGSGAGDWVPAYLLGGNSLSNNQAINEGLEQFRRATVNAQTNIQEELKRLNEVTDLLADYQTNEIRWLMNPDPADPCRGLPDKSKLDVAWSNLRAMRGAPLTNLGSHYALLTAAATNASGAFFQDIMDALPEAEKSSGIFGEIRQKLKQFASQAAAHVQTAYDQRRAQIDKLDADQMAYSNGRYVDDRWRLYTNACALRSLPFVPTTNDIGEQWTRFTELSGATEQWRTNLAAYRGPMADPVRNVCGVIGKEAEQNLKNTFIDAYVKLVTTRLGELAAGMWSTNEIAQARQWFFLMERDLAARKAVGDQAHKLEPLIGAVGETKKAVIKDINTFARGELGVPVLASGNPMDAAKMVAARKTLERLRSELLNPTWSSSPGGAEAVGALRETLASYEQIVGSLLNRDDSVAEWELSIVPWTLQNLSEKDMAVVSSLRNLRVTDGRGGRWEADLTNPNGALAKIQADRQLVLSFRKTPQQPNATKEEPLPAWWLATRIRDGGAEPLENGTKWRMRIAVEDVAQKLSGNAVFEVRLLNGMRFPQRSEWPK